MSPSVIVSAARKPIGSLQGQLRAIGAALLGSLAIAGAIMQANLDGQSP